MNTSTYAKPFTLALLLLLSACGGGGSSTSSSDSTSATNLVDWTWIGGSDSFGQPGSYGVKFTTNPVTITDPPNFPKALEGAISWSDNLGNLWLFGGGGETGYTDFNDLWKFDGSKWAWMNGDATPNQLSNFPSTVGTSNPVNASGPGSRQYSASWTDSTNNLWLFGGYVRTNAGGSTAYANDLWKFDTTNKQWTWVSGANTVNQVGTYGTKGGNVTPEPANIPGGRWGVAHWSASGALWLFGGAGYGSATFGYLNDWWKFDTTSKQWTWVSGDNTVNQVGIYGTKGGSATPEPANIPGARSGEAFWEDGNGNLWLFGGFRVDTVGPGDFNDLWKFNIATNQWTWMSGSNLIDQSGNYGTPGTMSSNYVPGSRRFAVFWKDNSGNFWLFGGLGYDSAGNFGDLNDLWKYNIATNQWSWMSGSKLRDQNGEYGTTGNSNSFVPGSRDVAVSWYDSINSRYWLFGGQGYDAYGSNGYLNDLWQFQPKP